MTTWNEAEEQAIAKLAQTGRLDRLGAIRLYRKCGSDLEKALALLSEAERVSGHVPYAIQNWRSRKAQATRS
jgi:hypothetical protein